MDRRETYLLKDSVSIRAICYFDNKITKKPRVQNEHIGRIKRVSNDDLSPIDANEMHLTNGKTIT